MIARFRFGVLASQRKVQLLGAVNNSSSESDESIRLGSGVWGLWAI